METAPISVRVITTSVSLTAERPFRLQETHVNPILFLVAIDNQSMLAFMGPKPINFFRAGSPNGSASMGTDLLFSFLSTAEHRLTRANFTLKLRASCWLEVFASVFVYVCLALHGLH